MKKIEAIIKNEKLEVVKEKLFEHGVTGITVTQVLGCGKQLGHKTYYRGSVVEINLLPKIKIEIVVSDDKADEIVDIIENAAKSNEIGDGKIFVYGIDNVVRIRTGDRGESAL